MPLQIINQDITKIHCDAVVNPTDSCFSGSGGTDRAIHEAAGPGLAEACSHLPPLGFSEVAETSGFNMPCRYIIHTMGPVWQGGDNNEASLLRACYVNALLKAKRLKLDSIAFPLISSGTFGFPKDKVLRIAIDAISDFIFASDSGPDVFICVIDRKAFELSKDIALKEYLNRSKKFVYEDHALKMESAGDMAPISLNICAAAPAGAFEEDREESLDYVIKHHDDTFAVLLLKLIDAKGMDEVECYKKANIHKNTFWKIKNDGKYRPSKPTVLAFAIALELTLDETNALLKSAGFAFSGNNYFDNIIEFYIRSGVYDIFEINAALYQYDQVCLGC